MWKYLSSEGINIFNVVDIFSRRGPHHCKVIKVSVSQLMSPTSDTNDHFFERSDVILFGKPSRFAVINVCNV